MTEFQERIIREVDEIRADTAKLFSHRSISSGAKYSLLSLLVAIEALGVELERRWGAEE